jgi:hypothetical protein
MSTSHKISVIQNSPSDWDEWIEIIKTQALAGKAWEYLNLPRTRFLRYKNPAPPQPTKSI